MEWLAQAGLSNALVATMLALLAAATSRARRPALTHGLWLLVLIKLVTPPIALVALLPAHKAASLPVDVLETVADDSHETAVATAAVPALDDLVIDADPAAARPDTAVREQPVRPAYPWLFLAWSAGAVAWWGLAARRIVRFARALCAARPADEALRDQVQALGGRLGLKHRPRVVFVPGRVPPLIWPIGRSPCLVLPESLWADLEPDAREALLTHELAHLRRRDHWTRWLELLTGGLYWWHPVVWWARSALRAAEEQCCDAWVVTARPDAARTYARALLATLDFLSEPRVALPPAASGIGHVSCLKRRMTMIVCAETPKSLSWRGRLVVFTLGAMLLPLAPTWAQRDEPRKETTPAPEAPSPEEQPRLDSADPFVRHRIDQYRQALERLGAMDQSVKKQLDEAFSQMEKAMKAGKINEEELRRNMERVRREVSEAMERARMAQRERRGEAETRGRVEPADSPERREQIEKARAEVRELHDKLRQAEDRLADLEGRPRLRFRVYRDLQSRVDERPAPSGADRPRDSLPKREEARPRDGDQRPEAPAREERVREDLRSTRTRGAPERRVRQLEERLESLMREMQQLKNELRRSDPKASSSDAAPKG